MPRLFTVLASVLVLAAGASSASAGGTFDAQVKSTATVVVHTASFTETNFYFDVFNCPADATIVVTWSATQPAIGSETHGDSISLTSSGDAIQHLTITTLGGFQPGLLWQGSGVVSCDLETVPVTGSGQTLSTNGV